MEFEYSRHRIDKRTPDQALVLLPAAAEHFDNRAFTKRDLNAAKLGVSATGVRNAFGSWAAGIEALKASFARDGITLEPKPRSGVADTDLFVEMQRVWTAVGHRPSRYEWDAASPKYPYNTYRRRFGGSTRLWFLPPDPPTCKTADDPPYTNDYFHAGLREIVHPAEQARRADRPGA